MKNDAFKISDDIYMLNAYGDGSKRLDQGHSLGKKEKLTTHREKRFIQNIT